MRNRRCRVHRHIHAPSMPASTCSIPATFTHGPQRDTHRPRAPFPARSGAALGQIRRQRAPAAPGSALTAAPPPSRPRWPIRSSASASIPSTSTARAPRPTVPIEDTVGAIAEMVKAGYVRHIASLRWALKPFAAPPPCIPLSTCRSSTRSSAAVRKQKSSRSSTNSASEPPPMERSRAVCSPARSPPRRETFAPGCRASRQTTWSGISSLSPA